MSSLCLPSVASPKTRRMWQTALLGLSAALFGAPATTTAQPAREPLTFEKHVLPIFRAHCLRCHGAEKQSGALDLRTKATLLAGGESGPALVPGSPTGSLLWEKLAKDRMPPGKDKLPAADKATLRAWIESGARADETVLAKTDGPDRQITDADRNFWAFQKPVRPPMPTVANKGRVRNPIDAFLLAALEKKGLTFSPEADRLTLLRRATFDLTGLPPSPKEIDDFLAHTAADAYEKVIDRLLASPHYGERWGRHWLDLAGYADSEGILDADYVRSAAWRYRDYVIRAFNADKPYDRFLQEQLAGDELIDYWTAFQTRKQLGPDVIEALTATGYLRCASDTSRPDFVNIKNAPGYYYQTLDDTLRIVASSTLGLTVHCAKCHSHKYDPIPQTDYYRMQAIFMSGYRPAQWVPQVQRRLHEATAQEEKEAKEHNARLDAVAAPLKKQAQELQRQYGERLFNERLAKLPAQIREDVRAALATAAAKRNEVQKYLASKFEAELRPAAAVLAKILPETYPEYRTKAAELATAVKTLEAQKRSFSEIRAFYDLPGEPKTPLLRRGDYLNPGPEVQPGVLSVLVAGKPFELAPRAKDAKTSGRRLAFARWLTQPDHPLTARVLVNRLWLHHFGRGLVATPDNFGRTGAPPSHPELLDWLATEFTARGWSMKAMHRLIMTSSAYRQTSALDPTAHANARRLDPDNALLWRQRLRRLEAEPLRDAVLSVAGTLNSQLYGPPVPMQRKGSGEIIVPDDASGSRRSVYLQVRRSQPLTFLQVFDQPVLETNCTHRETSTVSSQALTLLNSDFMVRQAEAFARRVLAEGASDTASYALKVAFGRLATEKERTQLTAFLDTQTAHHTRTGLQPQEARRRAVTDLCHMLLSANEFAYVD
ncbi:MAG TPA: PSD1 and planctomycete cytochrome C domain-containing protein [Gemmataceae bacterium]|nr:PSD1 and planctomycete cytochrome C domain-containing protein [Gemmataceae bacterium]